MHPPPPGPLPSPPLGLANIEIQIKAPKITTQTLKYIPMHLPIPMNSILVIIGSPPPTPKTIFLGASFVTPSNQIKLEGGYEDTQDRLGSRIHNPRESKIMLSEPSLGCGLLFLSYSHDGYQKNNQPLLK